MGEYWSREEIARWGRHQRILSGGRTITQQADVEDARHDRGDEGPRRPVPAPKPLVTTDEGPVLTHEDRLASFRASAARFGVPVEHRHVIKAALARGLDPQAAREEAIQAWLQVEEALSG